MARAKRTKEQNAAAYRARVERGRERGLTASEAAGQKKRAATARARAIKADATGRTRRYVRDQPPTDTAAGGVTMTKGRGAMRITSSDELSDTKAAILKAIANGSSITIRTTVWTDKGYRSVSFFDGRMDKRIGPGRNGLSSPIQVIEYRRGSGLAAADKALSGRDLRDLLNQLRAADSAEEWIYDLIDQEYEEVEYM